MTARERALMRLSVYLVEEGAHDIDAVREMIRAVGALPLPADPDAREEDRKRRVYCKRLLRSAGERIVSRLTYLGRKIEAS